MSRENANFAAGFPPGPGSRMIVDDSILLTAQGSPPEGAVGKLFLKSASPQRRLGLRGVMGAGVFRPPGFQPSPGWR
jgi:hypothetical protein